MDACLRQSMFPIMMEHIPASASEAIAESLGMVEKADIYVGIYAYRYGYIPDGHDTSLTEMEYNRAVERGIPRLIFIMDKTHPIIADQMSEGLGDEMEEARRRIKLKVFKERVSKENIVNFFKSVEDFRGLLINSLSQYRDGDAAASMHYVRDIPTAPELYIAHPYTLLQTGEVIGRRAELSLLTDWVAKPSSDIYKARILNFVAIGGMGKSALTWKWFNEIAPLEMKPLVGRMWWSFYESDASFENFIIRALAYVSGQSREEIEKNTKPGEREDQLLRLLDQKPFLLVLDGLERILIAYARMDAAHLSDSEYDKQTANYVAGTIGLPESAAQSFTGEHRLRKTADPRAGGFLRKLTLVKQSRILISTRLYPRDLQTETDKPLPNCAAIFLTGLQDEDAVDLWRVMGNGSQRFT
jgi:hypothetical protein